MNAAAMRRAVARKRDGEALEAATWDAIVAGALDGSVDDAPLAALLMACVLRGMAPAETLALTAAFVASGETLVAPDVRTVDKHSSGGVGDTASLVVVPLVAACGVPVAKLSGRALGHTGGTLDKLEALPGVRTDLAPERFFAIVAEVGCAIAAQGARLVPGDGRFYALRDRTATVPAPGLIAASIVAKKIAGGARAIVYDVKCGSGAFLAEPRAARELASSLVDLSAAFGRPARAVVSDMNEPLGPAIGTALELCEARDFLSGARRSPRLDALCRTVAAAMLAAAGVRDAAALDRALASGAAYETFERMLVAQGAAPGALAALRPHAARSVVRAARGGYVAAIAPVALGEAARDLVAGAGAGAGVELAVRVGVRVAAGDPLATVFGDAAATADVLRCFTIDEAPPPARPLIYDEIDAPSAASATTGSPRSTLESR